MDIELAKRNMLTQQIRTWDVLDDVVLDVISNTPRQDFVPSSYYDLAFADLSIPLGHDQSMLTPMEEARILQALKVLPTEIVLEVGTGSGYMTALLAKLAKYVYSVDIFPDFCASAQLKLAKLALNNVSTINADAARGWDEQMPYDVVVITGSLPILAADFRQCLKPGGRLFAILGKEPTMEATLLTYTHRGSWIEEKLFETIVPPLLNAPEVSTFVF